jgi:hypothetical protein
MSDIGMELLGVAALAGDDALTNLVVACRALSYHPPSRRRSEPSLVQYLQGGGLVLEEA